MKFPGIMWLRALRCCSGIYCPDMTSPTTGIHFAFTFFSCPSLLLQKLTFIEHQLGWLHPSPLTPALICQHGFWLISQHYFISLESATRDLLVQFDPVTPGLCTSQVSLLMLLFTYLWNSKHELPKVCSHVLFMIAFHFLFPWWKKHPMLKQLLQHFLASLSVCRICLWS